MEILAIIPARGGSKGIPRKNIRLLAGKPLLAYTIEAAKAAPAINRIVVSTDDAEIGQVANSYGAEVVWRPAEISGDTASSESALSHVLAHLQESEHYTPDLVVFLQATSPLRGPNDVREGIETFLREGADSLFSASAMHGFMWRRTAENEWQSLTYDYRNRQRRQDGPDDVFENGSFYVFKPWVLHDLQNRLGGKITAFRQPAVMAFQIDEPSDFELLTLLIQAQATTNS